MALTSYASNVNLLYLDYRLKLIMKLCFRVISKDDDNDLISSKFISKSSLKVS